MTRYRDEPAGRAPRSQSDRAQGGTPEFTSGVPDEELCDLLRRWDAPALPDGLDERMLARYRRRHVAWWRRPVPVRFSLSVAASVLLVASGAILAGRSRPATSESASAPASPVVTTAAQVEAAPARTSLAGFRPMAEVTATVVTVSP
jgi:hypothetical protein